MEQVSNLNNLFDTSGAEPIRETFNLKGVHKLKGVPGTPVAVDIHIRLKYNANATYEPWGYELTVPTEDNFHNFLSEAGYLGTRSYGTFKGYSDQTFDTAQAAEEAAVEVAKNVVSRYREYLKAKNEIKEYTLTLPLDSDDDKE